LDKLSSSVRQARRVVVFQGTLRFFFFLEFLLRLVHVEDLAQNGSPILWRDPLFNLRKLPSIGENISKYPLHSECRAQ